MQRYLSCFVTALFVFAVLPGSVQGQDDAIREAIDKAVEQAKKAVAQEVEKVVQASEKRIAELEKALEQKDDRIAELEAKVRELSESKKPPARAAFLGVGHVDPPGDLREKLGIETGALVTQVVPQSPAASAGLQAGDVIVAVGDAEVASADLGAQVSKMRPGEEVGITFFREGKKVTKTAKLVDREKFLSERPIPVPPVPIEPKKEPVVLGIRIEERDDGIFVTDVEGGFTGSVAGLKSGDKLVEVNGNKLGVIEDVVGALKDVVEGDELTLTYQRNDEKLAAKVIGAHGDKGAKLVEMKKSGEKPKKRGYLGVSVVPVNSGIQIKSVLPETAAAAAGLEPGDVIQEINGKPVQDVNQLKEQLSARSAGDKITLKLQRGGKVVNAEVVLAAEGEKVKVPEKAEPVKPETPKVPGRLGIKASQSRDNIVSVKTVEAGGPADKAGLKAGDILLKANGKDVRSLDDIAVALQALFAGDSLKLRVKRGEQEKEISVTLEKR